MKASRCPSTCAARILAVLTTATLLVQCSMPPQQAWRSIQTNGLLPYLAGSRPSPPFRTGGLYSQRYAAYPQRPHYGVTRPTGYASNSYFSTLPSGLGSSRYVPRSRPSSPSVERSPRPPRVKLPVEEPEAAPRIVNNQPPGNPAPKTTDSATEAAENLPYGTTIPGRTNMVNSPFAGKTQLVDVSGMSAGQTVKCPYTGKLFKVPPTQQATNRVEPRLESKVEAPKLPEEPPADDKKP